MKTRVFTYMKALLMATLLVGFSSCEVELGVFWDTDNNGSTYSAKSQDLCSRTWVDIYYDADGNRCRQELNFYTNRTGTDFIRIEYRNGGVYVNEYAFKWSWENYSQTTLRMSYGPGDVSYLENLQLRGNSLSGYLDGWNNFVEYTGRY